MKKIGGILIALSLCAVFSFVSTSKALNPEKPLVAEHGIVPGFFAISYKF